MGKFTKNNFLNTFNKIKEFFRHSHIALSAYEILTEKIDQIKTTTHSNSYDDNTDNLDNSNEYTPTPKRRR